MTIGAHVAFHYIGCARADAQGVHVPSRMGALIDALAGSVGKLTVLAYEPPTNPEYADGTEYVIDRPNVSFCSLGPKGTWRNYLARRRTVASAVASASVAWDVVIYVVPNRRVGLVRRADRCPRTVSFIVATTARAPRTSRSALRAAIDAFNIVSQRFQQWRVVRASKVTIVNSEGLLPYASRRSRIVRVAWLSARRDHQTFEASDRLDSGEVALFYAGRLTLEKGVLDAVEALALVQRELPNVRLHVAGEGPVEAEMLARARELGVADRITMHGWIAAGDELFALYRQMDVFIMPSYADYEGFPCVVWEALAHSLLLVCTAVRGPRESLTHEREVLFVPMHAPQAIADAVVRLVRDPELRRRLLATGFERARSTSVDGTVRSFVDAMTSAWPELDGQQ